MLNSVFCCSRQSVNLFVSSVLAIESEQVDELIPANLSKRSRSTPGCSSQSFSNIYPFYVDQELLLDRIIWLTSWLGQSHNIIELIHKQSHLSPRKPECAGTWIPPFCHSLNQTVVDGSLANCQCHLQSTIIQVVWEHT